MNAALKPQYLARQFSERCEFDEMLVLELVGECDRERGYVVETVKAAGTEANLTVLFSNRQLENLGRWLDLKNGDVEQRRWARVHLEQAQRLG